MPSSTLVLVLVLAASVYDGGVTTSTSTIYISATFTQTTQLVN